ncbi:aminoglycoside phosphotransferase family protein [bacterium]|nr:aminoglycoside phosphotransferase family protein [bacterium]MDB4695319.1 aminoglycoside phosphotransferase family protein [Akkermansiaceae bacterium]
MKNFLYKIKEIANEFAIPGDFISGVEVDSGHINSTYLVEFGSDNGLNDCYVLQRINEVVFPNPQAVMRNVEVVTRHINWKVLRVKRDLSGQTLNLFPARGGRFHVEIERDGIWRCYNFIKGCRTYDIVENPRQAYEAAKAFGSFQDLVSDIPLENIEETIPDFHNTPQRYKNLMQAVAEDPLNRVKGLKKELDFVRSNKATISRLIDLRNAGVLPERITHNDTKINNVMIDSETDEAVCVIDLDTVMPGLSLYDFGDMVRTAVSPAAEDEQDLSRVIVRMPIFEALVEGYLDGCNCLCEGEIDNLAFSGGLIALETGMRFLTDHLLGDVYFKISRENQNLDRARNQFRLSEELARYQPQMQGCVENHVKIRKTSLVG